MNIYLILYIMFGIATIFYVLKLIDERGITGDQIIESVSYDDVRQYFYDNPIAYKFIIGIVLILMGIGWPWTLYNLFNNDDFNNFGEL